jgi:hypothetical protein
MRRRRPRSPRGGVALAKSDHLDITARVVHQSVRELWKDHGMSDSYAPLLDLYRSRERVSLAEVGEAVGMDRSARSRAVKDGSVHPVGRAGLGGGYVITRDDALLIVVAAMIAVAAGIAVATALRGLAGSGLSGAALAAAIPK